jgi:hypothetical protein
MACRGLKQPVLAVGRDIDGGTFLFKPALDESRHLCLVFYNQYAHRH